MWKEILNIVKKIIYNSLLKKERMWIRHFSEEETVQGVYKPKGTQSAPGRKILEIPDTGIHEQVWRSCALPLKRKFASYSCDYIFSFNTPVGFCPLSGTWGS